MKNSKIKINIVVLLIFISILAGCKKKEVATHPWRLKPGSAEFFLNQGLFHLNSGQINMAENKLLKAIKKKPYLKEALNGLGIVYMYKREFDKSIKYFKKVLNIDHAFIDAYNSLGLIYTELNKYDLAKENLLIAANSDDYSTPENSFVNLAMLEIKHNKLKSAMRYIEKGIHKNRGFAPLYNLQGIIFENQKNYKKALYSYKKALSLLAEDDITILINIGRVYSKMGEKNQALDFLEKALSKAINSKIKDTIRKMIRGLNKE